MKRLSEEQKRKNKLDLIKKKAEGNSLKDDNKYEILRRNFICWTDYPELGVDDVSVKSTTIKGEFHCSNSDCDNNICSRPIYKIVEFNTDCKCMECQKEISAMKRTKTESKKGNTISCIAKRSDLLGERARQLIDSFISFEKYPDLSIEDCCIGSHYEANWICMGRQSDKCEKVFSRTVCSMMRLDRNCYCKSCSKELSTINKVKQNAKCNPLSDSPRFKEITSGKDGLIFLYCVDHPELRENELSEGSGFYAEWKCRKCNNNFPAIISNVILKESGCPHCSGLLPLWGVNDLYTYCLKNRPDLINYWVEEENGPMENYTFCSGINVSWVCPLCGSNFKRAISKRIKSRELCFECSKKFKDSIPQRLLYYYLVKFLPHTSIIYGYRNKEWLDKREIDIYLDDGNNSYAIEYDGYLHRIDEDIKKDKMCKDKGVKLIRVREPEAESYGGNNAYGAIVIERITNAIDDDLNNAISRVLEIVGVPKSKIEQVDVKKDAMYVLGIGRNKVLYEKSLEYCKPRAAAYFKNMNCEDFEKTVLAKNISANSNIPCSFCHTDDKTGIIHNWITIPNNIVDTEDKPYTCPVCRNKYFVEGVNDFATLHPDLLLDWDYKKNDKEGIYPNKLLGAPSVGVNWLCKKHNYAYVATPNSRVYSGTGCKYCGREKLTRSVEAINTEDGRIVSASSVTELAHKIGYKQNSVSAALTSGKILGGRKRLICSTDEDALNILRKYKSLDEASCDLKISKNRIRKAQANNTCVDGFWFSYENVKIGWKVRYLDNKKKQEKRKVKNTDNGQIFDSIKAASVSVGVSQSSICKSLKTGFKSGGYHWEYAE